MKMLRDCLIVCDFRSDKKEKISLENKTVAATKDHRIIPLPILRIMDSMITIDAVLLLP
jgi:hypothetical protein